MRVARTALCIVILAGVFILGGCDYTAASQHAMLSGAASKRIVMIPAVSANQQPAEMTRPVRLIIPVIEVSAHIEAVGVLPNGDLATPTQHPWEDAGWYQSGPRPGERGSAVIDGHLDRPGGYPAVFWRLRELQAGDEVQVLNSDGTILHFHVTRVALYPPQAAPIQDIFGNRGGSYLNLITCAGDWIPSEHQTTLRLVIYTSLG